MDYANKAAEWWANKLLDNAPHDNGARNEPASAMACLFADMLKKPISERQIEAFKSALVHGIYAHRKEFGEYFPEISIGCDYGPCDLLYDAAKEAEISCNNFPFKTWMVIEKDGRVLVKDGYGKPYTEI